MQAMLAKRVSLLLASMPDVGTDNDFAREQTDRRA
jgi:hypothetical protein